MMTRLQKKRKKNKNKDKVPSFIDTISTLPAQELIKKIEGDGLGSDYTNQELISIIEANHLHLWVSHLAYLSLVIKGSISDLQRLATVMDFSSKDSCGNDAFRIAAIYGRIEVMHWLHEKIDRFKNIPADERTNVVLHAITNNRTDVLEELVKPEDKGGFGWSLNVKHANGFTPVKMAVKDKNTYLAMRLIAPVDEGGFGLKIEKTELRGLDFRSEFALFSGAAPRFRRSKPEKRTSSFTLIDNAAVDHRTEAYEPESAIGSGAYGSVRLFAATSDKTKKMAVKQAGDNIKKSVLSGYHVHVSAENAVCELEYLKRAYPNEGPYKLQHYVINDGTGYDYRMIMPFVPGNEFRETVLATRSAEEAARLLQAIAAELQRIHDLGIVHGDPRPRNILTDVTRDENGEPTFKVHFVDFYNANDIGELATIYTDKREDIPPEQVGKDTKKTRVHPSQDVYVMGYYFKSVLKHFEKELSAQFPSIIKFCDACTKENSDERPTLKEFIRDVEQDLLACKPDDVFPVNRPLM